MSYPDHVIPPKDRLIVALDVPTKEEALALVNALSPLVSFYKVGWELFLAAGPDIVRTLKAKNLQVFLDLKMQEDVDQTISRYIQVVVREGVDFVTLHGNGRIFRVAKRAKGEAPVKLLALTLLSSLDEADMRDNYLLYNGSTYSFPFQRAEEYVCWRADTAVQAGCDGLIASGQFVRLLHDRFRDRTPPPLLVVPGIRLEGAPRDEHKHTLTPRDAIAGGADYLVVGRPITQAATPREAAQAIIDEIAAESARLAV
ncbi:MAG: orotidine-5'-phosphate decarboxylase [Nitrospirae bacterium]|nr:MAG: orotidine-5'-phosphate decarboxylase [Nitrospirota bacterium]